MTNLIPPQAKKNIAREYWTRVASLGLFIIGCLIFAVVALLLPVYVLLQSRLSAYGESAEIALSDSASYQLSSSVLSVASKESGLLLELKEQQRFSDLQKKLEGKANSDLKIERFSFQQTSAGLEPIAISGKAITRQALADFREALLNDKDIDKVLLPISNLAQDKDISFSVTVTMKAEPEI